MAKSVSRVSVCGYFSCISCRLLLRPTLSVRGYLYVHLFTCMFVDGAGLVPGIAEFWLEWGSRLKCFTVIRRVPPVQGCWWKQEADRILCSLRLIRLAASDCYLGTKAKGGNFSFPVSCSGSQTCRRSWNT